MNNRIDAVYARQSVDKKDSISIESQIGFCKYELKGGGYREYTDKGYSGKNTDRPKFQELIRDIQKGLIRKVVVYKLDRISRSILDFANMMELFQQYGVEFVSSTEKFDTSTPMGRAMLNICIVFAQLERETIQRRVTDAYYSRSQKGFKMGGKPPYGFHTEPIVMEGIHTKRLVVNPEEAANIRLLLEMYAEPKTSYGDITRYFAEQGILFYDKELIRPTLAQMLRNPVYAQADLDVYDFFKSQGTVIVNDAADFTGANSCYLYQGREVKTLKKYDLKDQMLVIAPHEGIVPSDIWLACRKKLMNNMKIQSARKATHTWLAGKIKCGNCGYALMSIINRVGTQYLRCTKRLDNKSCIGCGKIYTAELEALVYQQMVKKLESYKTLTGRKKAAKGNPKITAMQVELAHVDGEIEKLVDSLTGANNVLLSYVNVKIAELDSRKQALVKEVAELTVETISPEQVKQISGYLDTWDSVSFDDKRRVLDLLVVTVEATSEKLNITWKI
jgi:Site-specific recombinases, DNA invertase Pin homologs